MVLSWDNDPTFWNPRNVLSSAMCLHAKTHLWFVFVFVFHFIEYKFFKKREQKFASFSSRMLEKQGDRS